MDDRFNIIEKSGAVIVELRMKKVDMFNVPEIRGLLNEHIEKQPPLIIIDLEQTAFMDSSAMGYLFKLHRDVETYGGRLCLASVQKKLNQLLTLNGANKYFDSYESVDEAIQSKGR